MEKDGSLTIENVSPQDGGNYTCSIVSTNAENDNKNVDHQLIVISLPTFSIQEPLLYNMTAKCELTDVDIMALYMPNNLRNLLCGFESKICTIQVHQPHCVRKVSKVIDTS